MSRLDEVRLEADRTSTGLRTLDRLLEGGYPTGRAVLVCGPAGSGKTTMGLQFLLAGIEAGDTGAFVTVDEKPRHIVEDAHRLGWDLEPMMANGRLALLDASPFFTATRDRRRNGSSVDAQQVASDLMRAVRKAGARRLVIDTLTSLVPPDMTPGEAHDYLRSLVQSLEDSMDCTLILTCRGSRGDPQRGCQAARYLTSGVVELRLACRSDGLVRQLRIRKMRGTPCDLADHPLGIEPGVGLSLQGNTVDRGQAVLHTVAAG